jgi:Tfp pilus assembly protein PilN
MININLIPPSARKHGQDNVTLAINLPQEILLGVGSGVVLLLVTVHLILTLLWVVGFVRLSVERVQWQGLSADKAVLDGINGESRDLKAKINVISGMTTKKAVSWAPKFNAISDGLPRGVWIRKMTLDKTGLTIEGSVVSKTRSEINNVGLFLSALKSNNDFIKDFSSLEVNSIQRGTTNAVDVTDFTVMAKLK